MLRWITLGMLAAALLLSTNVAQASHSWGNYHWARMSNPFTLKLVDSVTPVWQPYLDTTSSDWSTSTVLDTVIIAGDESSTSRKKCSPLAGKIRVCNQTFGPIGWLGVAQIWASGSHITQGRVKLNDTYFNTTTYNTQGWRSLVLCQEVGHTFGLGHQDEDFSNAPIDPHTCMDYFVPTANEVVHPNQHDYGQLEAIYHCNANNVCDSSNSFAAQANEASVPNAGTHDDDEDFGTPTGKKDSHGRDILFVKHLGGGQKVYTWVNWAGHGKPD